MGASGITTGTLYTTSITSGSAQISGTVSAGTIVGTLVSAGSMGTSAATIGTLYASGITAGNINFTGNLYQNGSLYTSGGGGGGSSQWTTTNGNISYTSGSVIASNLVANNVNFGISSFYGASFNAANNVSAATNVTGFLFNSSAVVSFTANVSVSIYASTNLYETFTFYGSNSSNGWILNTYSYGDISGVTFSITSDGQIRYTSTNVAGWTSAIIRYTVNQNSVTGNYSSLSQPTSGNTYIYDSITLTNTNDSLSLSSTGSMNIMGGLTVQKSIYANTVSAGNLYVVNFTTGNFTASNLSVTTLSAGNFTITNLTSSNLVADNINCGISSFYGASFNAANNVSAATNVTGFLFNSSAVVSFTANVSVSIYATTNLYENFTFYGTYSSNGWILNTYSRGDITGIVFSITSGGQIRYTSTNIAGWTSATIRYTVNQNSVTGNYSSLLQPTSGNTYIYDSITLTNTNDSLSLSSTGSMNIMGGLTVQKSIYANTVSAGNLYVVNFTTGNFTASNLSVTALSAGNFTITNLTSNNLVANNINCGINSTYSGSFNAANNVITPTNITDLSFNSSNVVSFTANVSVIVGIFSSNTNFETFTLNGSYSSNGWILNSTSRGDITGIVFSITSGGQIRYTSTNIAGWTSSTFRYTVNQHSVTGYYSTLTQLTSGNTYIFDSITLTNTNDSLSLSSTGSMNILGGITVQKSLYAATLSTASLYTTTFTATNFNSSFNISTGTLRLGNTYGIDFGSAITGYQNIGLFNNGTQFYGFGTINSDIYYEAGNSTSNHKFYINSSVGNSLNAAGTQVMNISSTGISSSNLALSGNFSASTIVGTLVSSGSIATIGITTGTLYANNITCATIGLSGTVSATLFTSASIGASGATIGTLYATTITSGSIVVSGTISAGTHVGTLFSSASINASNATIGTLNIPSGITSGGVILAGGGLRIPNSNLGAFKIITGTIGILALAANGTVSGSFLYNNNYYFSANPTVTLSVIGGSNAYYALAVLNGYDASGGSFYVTNINGSFTTTPVMSYIAVGPV